MEDNKSSIKNLLALFSHLLKNSHEFQYVPNWLFTRFSFKNPINAELPWFPYSLQTYLKKYLTKQSFVFEYGSGGSTLWFSKYVKQIISVEHDGVWGSMLEEKIKNLPNCKLLFLYPGNGKRNTSSVAIGDFTDYIHAIDSYKDKSFDLVVVDGRCRIKCLLQSMKKVKKGGLLMLDDSYREKYKESMIILKDWKRIDFYGIRPFGLLPSKSSIWIAH